MPLPARYINGTDVLANATPAQIFVSADASRIGVRVVCTEEGEGIRIYVGTSNALTATEKVLAILGPREGRDIYCSSAQTLWVRTEGADRTITVWEVVP